jgi:hypothetical protein
MGGPSSPEFTSSRLTRAAGRDGSGFVSALFEAVSHHILVSHLRVTLHTGTESSDEFSMRFRENEGSIPWSVDLIFDDGSAATAYPPEDLPDIPGIPRDDPSRVLEPVEPDEYGVIESLIGELRNMLDGAEGIRDEARLRLEGAIEVLSGTHRAVEVGETRRIELLAPTKAVLVYLRSGLPGDFLKWVGAIEVIKATYPNLAEFIKQLLS